MNSLNGNIKSSQISDIQDCSICLDKLATPVQLACGHIFDLDCISNWFHLNKTCPIDRMPIEAEKIIYRSDLIEKTGVVFQFQTVSGQKIDPIMVSIDSSVQKLKAIFDIKMCVDDSESNIVRAAFNPYRANCIPDAERWCCIFNLPSGKQILYSDYILSQYPLEVGKNYKISALRTSARIDL
jgi:hypothetical protein